MLNETKTFLIFRFINNANKIKIGSAVFKLEPSLVIIRIEIIPSSDMIYTEDLTFRLDDKRKKYKNLCIDSLMEKL